MADIASNLDAISKAVYGEQVRGSIVDAIRAVHDENESYAQLKIDLNTIKSDVETDAANIKTTIETAIQKSINIFDVDNIEVNSGYFDSSGNYKNSSSGKCFYVPVEPETTYTISGYLTYLCFYDTNKTFLSRLSSSSDDTVANTFTTPANCKYLGITVSNSKNLSAYMIVVGNSLPASYTAPGTFINNININGLPNISKKISGETLGWITPEYTNFLQESFNVFNNNAINAEYNCYYQFSDGVKKSSQNYDALKITTLMANMKYTVSCYGFIAFYDNTGKFISGINIATDDKKTFTVPTNTDYAIFSIAKTIDKSQIMICYGSFVSPTFEPYYIKLLGTDISKIDTLESKLSETIAENKSWKNKNYLVFGDSFTGMVQGTNTNWTTRFKNIMLPNSFTNMAVSGTSYSDLNNNASGCGSVLDRVRTAIADSTITNPDVITILCGANETAARYSNIDNLESYFTDTDGKIINVDSIDTNNTIGAMRWVYEKLMLTYPNAKIFMCTPTQEGVTSAGNFFRSYSDTLVKRNAQIKIAERMGIEVIDTFKCGFYTNNWSKYIGSDGIHPNEYGATLICNTIAKSVKNWFKNN
jgi:lysophospholipase L1-like esterase